MKTSSLLSNTTKPTAGRPSRQSDSNYGAFGIKKKADEKEYGVSASGSGAGTTVGRHQRLAFGDNYGNARDFAKPDEETKESIKNVSELP